MAIGLTHSKALILSIKPVFSICSLPLALFTFIHKGFIWYIYFKFNN